MSNLSFSRLKRAKLCPGSVILPQVDDVSPMSARGTIIHRHIEAVLSGDVQAMETVREAAVEIDGLGDSQDGPGPPGSITRVIDGMNPDDVAALALGDATVKVELAVWYHPITDEAGILGTRLDRDYSKAPRGAICGTIDLASWTTDLIEIVDWKSGWAEQDPAETNRQLTAAAVALSRALDIDKVQIRIATIGEDGKIYPLAPAVLGPFELDAAAGDLGMITERIEIERDGARPTLLVGEHCRYCPAFAACPAQAGMATALIDLVDKPEALTADLIREAWPRFQAVKAALPKVDAAIKEFVRQTPVELDDGKILGMYERGGRSKMASLEIYNLVLEHVGEEGAQALIAESTLSRAAIVRAIGEGYTAHVMAKAGSLGHVTPTTQVRLEAKRPKKGK